MLLLLLLSPVALVRRGRSVGAHILSNLIKRVLAIGTSSDWCNQVSAIIHGRRKGVGSKYALDRGLELCWQRGQVISVGIGIRWVGRIMVLKQQIMYKNAKFLIFYCFCGEHFVYLGSYVTAFFMLYRHFHREHRGLGVEKLLLLFFFFFFFFLLLFFFFFLRGHFVKKCS